MDYKSETKSCQNCKQNFTIDPEDFLFYEKIKVPPPSFCPECRMLRRTSFRNVRSLYKRNCGMCEKPTINMYHNEDSCVVYCNSCWNSDTWDPSAYAMDIDFSKPFLLQWFELFKRVPRFALLHNGSMVDSDYTNYSVNNKSCYLSYSVVNCEDVRYSENIDKTRNSLDNLYLYESDLCYENIDCVKNYHTHFSLNSKNCIDSFFYLTVLIVKTVLCLQIYEINNMYLITNNFLEKNT